MLLPFHEVHEGNGPPLLMVHGILSSRAQWMPNLDALRSVATPVVVELFGHGRSPAPDAAHCYRPEYYLRTFEAIREQIGTDRWHVLGYSLGAGLTMRYSLEHPDRVIAQMFTNSTSAFAEETTTRPMRQNADTIIEQYRRDGKAAVDSIAVHPKNAKRLPADVKAALLEDCALLDPVAVAQTIVHTNGNSSVRSTIKDNAVPTLLICGDKERRFTPHRAFAEKTMPNLKVRALATGHAVNAEAADEFNKAVIGFLEDNPA